jgi:Fe-S-cluster containining protein
MEAYHIRDLVEALPEPRRAEVKKKFADGFEHFFENGWFERMNEYGKMSYEKRVETVMEYFYEGIACPFLEEESCSIHLSRPLICREYLVTSPPENCGSPSATTVKMLKLPVKVSESVRQFNRTEHFVPMIAALAFAAKFPEDDTEKPGTEWMGEFFTHLAGQESSPQAN